MEVLVEQWRVPAWVLLEALTVAEHRTAAIRPLQERRHEPPPQLLGYLAQIHHDAASRRAFDEELVAEVHVIALECLDDEVVDREPHGPPPVRVATVDRRRRLRGLIIDAVLLTIDVDLVRRTFESLGHRAQTMRREHRILAQDLHENPTQVIGINHGEQGLAPVGALLHRDEACAHLIAALLDAMAAQEVEDAILIAGSLGESRRLVDDRAGKDGDDADEGSHLDGISRAIWADQLVVEEAVFDIE